MLIKGQPAIANLTANNNSGQNHKQLQKSNKITNANWKDKRQNNLLKFLDNKHDDTNKRNLGIRCSSFNTYGVSQNSPDFFKTSHTVIVNSPPRPARSSKFHQNPQHEGSQNKDRAEIGNRFNPQKNYFKINDESQLQKFQPEYMKAVKLIKAPFNVKKSEYTDFIQMNIASQWNKQYPLMGNQRTIQSRHINNKDRSILIEQKRKTRENFLKTFCQQRSDSNFNSINSHKRSRSIDIRLTNTEEMFANKVKIRSQRNQLANRLTDETCSYIQKQKKNENNLQKFRSTQYRKTKDNFNSNADASRPVTSLSHTKSCNKSIKGAKNRVLDIWKQYGNYSILIKKRAYSTVQQTNLTQQKNEQMLSKLQQWQNRCHMKKLSQCQSHTRRKKVENSPKQTDGSLDRKQLRQSQI